MENVGQTVCNQPMGASLGAMPAEKNKYALLDFKRTMSNPNDTEGTQMFQEITFYKMNQDGSFENGTTLEEMLRVTIERLKDLNLRLPCRENSVAITKVEEALMWLNKRTEDRKARGVEGQHLL